MVGEYLDSIIEGDCLKIMSHIADSSIDMVLCDLPYGCTQNKWDSVIDLQQLWVHYKRIIKPNGVIALMAQGAFTGQVITSNTDWFKYKIVWIKSKSTNFLNASKQPLRRHEDICVFYKKQPCYQPQKLAGVPYDKGVRKDSMSGTYGKFNAFRINNEDGSRFPYDVLFYEEEFTDWIYNKTAEYDGTYHPTQKPISLGRWLIRTYTRPGDIVLDNACGSGSFLVAAILEQRHFIGIEKNDKSYHFNQPVDFIDICNRRVKDALHQRD